MHRSGTSVLTNTLEKAGLFLGKAKDQNSEAVLFQKLNNWIFMNANASWDNPDNLQFMNDFFVRHQVRVCEKHLHDFRSVNYMGIKNFLRFHDIRNLNFPWGWKDPRNTFTIPVWKKIFPSLRLIHIYRHPIDVAESLRAREERVKLKPKNTWSNYIAEWTLRERVNYVNSLRIHQIAEGFALWKTYTKKAFSYSEEFGENILHIRYESLLENPEENLALIFNFIGFNKEKVSLNEIVPDFNKSRAFSFQTHPELMDFYSTIRTDELVRSLNYDTI